MEHLWAPWRIGYILGYKDTGCIFCTKPAESDDRKNYILERCEKSFVVMNIFPYNIGHLMVSPYRHIAEMSQLTDEELLELMRVTAKWVDIVKEALDAQGFNIGVNLGRVAGAGFDQHIHFHIVPRWNGDTNFMPVLGDTRILNRSLDEAYNLFLGKLKRKIEL